MKIDKQKQGKRNLASGRRFELKVYKDLEEKGWICARWTKNVELNPVRLQSADFGNKGKPSIDIKGNIGKLVPAKQGKFRKTSTGFPDFITFRTSVDVRSDKYYYDVCGVESKSNGYLDKEEKEKCRWLLDNNVFSKIFIAKKGKVRGKIEYKEFT
ncbi:hypothetical protein LCGC14_1472770 [marine sediment metagenome]|uniref:Uncharacterized protein n=1 Tax=marine sediment metagenome TaxID=412755 RepID=A0A0F9JBW9_9ZZZZ